MLLVATETICDFGGRIAAAAHDSGNVERRISDPPIWKLGCQDQA